MEYSAIALVFITGLLVYNEIYALKKVIQKQEKRLNQLVDRLQLTRQKF